MKDYMNGVELSLKILSGEITSSRDLTSSPDIDLYIKLRREYNIKSNLEAFEKIKELYKH